MMYNLLYELYHYAAKHQTDTYLERENEEIKDNQQMCTRSLEKFKVALSPEMWEQVDNYVSGRVILEDIHNEAFFYSGLAMGLSFGRMTVGL